jgi:hypothetical protein
MGRAQVVITFEELAERLKLPGNPIAAKVDNMPGTLSILIEGHQYPNVLPGCDPEVIPLPPQHRWHATNSMTPHDMARETAWNAESGKKPSEPR